MMVATRKYNFHCKKLLILLIIGVFYNEVILSQCLLSNGSFERWKYPLSPTTSMCVSGELNNNMLVNWGQPFSVATSSPDYFNSCANIYGGVPCAYQGHCVPLNFVGYQNSHSGNGYIGIVNLSSISPPPPPPTSIVYREYIEATLDTTLIKGNCYHFKMYCSYGDSLCSNISPTIGVYFSDTFIKGSIQNIQYVSLYLQAQIENSPLNWDTINWFAVEGDYTAHGGERFLTIGNFRTDTQSINYPYRNSYQILSYVYIDDVSLVPCEADTIHGEKYTICYGDSVTLKLDSLAPMPTSPCNAGLNYCHWYDKRHTPLSSGFNYTIKPTRDTVLYTIRGNDTCTCGYYQDSFTIHVVPPIGKDKNHYDTLCAGESKQLIADTLQATYKWYNYFNVLVANTKAYTINPVNSTRYYLTLQDSLQLCTSRTDTFNVQVLDPPCAKVAIPTAFTPNGDGANDVFTPIFYQNNTSAMQMRIYNRWGEIVYNGNGVWDGKYKGVLQPNDTYFYVVDINGEYFKGNVELMK